MTPDELGGALSALPPRVRKVLDTAAENGWTEKTTSLVVRLDHPDGLPFYATWHWVEVDDKRSWRFQGARAKNGQALNYNDIFVYLEDPAVIYPEPPDDEKPAGKCPTCGTADLTYGRKQCQACNVLEGMSGKRRGSAEEGSQEGPA